jgi:hypothetical protein
MQCKSQLAAPCHLGKSTTYYGLHASASADLLCVLLQWQIRASCCKKRTATPQFARISNAHRCEFPCSLDSSTAPLPVDRQDPLQVPSVSTVLDWTGISCMLFHSFIRLFPGIRPLMTYPCRLFLLSFTSSRYILESWGPGGRPTQAITLYTNLSTWLQLGPRRGHPL